MLMQVHEDFGCNLQIADAKLYLLPGNNLDEVESDCNDNN
jgi:hypothetical protein